MSSIIFGIHKRNQHSSYSYLNLSRRQLRPSFELWSWHGRRSSPSLSGPPPQTGGALPPPPPTTNGRRRLLGPSTPCRRRSPCSATDCGRRGRRLPRVRKEAHTAVGAQQQRAHRAAPPSAAPVKSEPRRNWNKKPPLPVTGVLFLFCRCIDWVLNNQYIPLLALLRSCRRASSTSALFEKIWLSIVIQIDYMKDKVISLFQLYSIKILKTELSEETTNLFLLQSHSVQYRQHPTTGGTFLLDSFTFFSDLVCQI